MKKSRAISVTSIVFALLLAFGAAYLDGSVLMTIIVESGQLNRDVASGNSTYYLNGPYSEGHSGLFNVNATTAFPRAIVLKESFFLMNVTFAMMLPANISYFSCEVVYAAFNPVPNPDFEFYDSLAYGAEALEPTVVITRESMGGTGIALWNVTMWMDISSPPLVDISQNQSWLSFISQAKTNLSVFLGGDGNMTAANGNNYTYQLEDVFNFPGVASTFYLFNTSVGGWLGGALGMGVVVLYCLGPKKRRDKLWSRPFLGSQCLIPRHADARVVE